MAPQPVQNASRKFVATSLSGGVETNIWESNPLPPNFTTEGTTIRETAYQTARDLLEQHPEWEANLIYSPANLGGDHLDSDLVWDSRISS